MQPIYCQNQPDYCQIPASYCQNQPSTSTTMLFRTASYLKVCPTASFVVEYELIWHIEDELRRLVDRESDRHIHGLRHSRRKFRVGGPFLPGLPESQAPLVIIPAIRFSNGRNSRQFHDAMVDRAVEAASFLITSRMKRPALIYPWIRIHQCSKV